MSTYHPYSYRIQNLFNLFPSSCPHVDYGPILRPCTTPPYYGPVLRPRTTASYYGPVLRPSTTASYYGLVLRPRTTPQYYGPALRSHTTPPYYGPALLASPQAVLCMIAVHYGDSKRLIHGYDSFGNVCNSANNKHIKGIAMSGMNTTGLEFVRPTHPSACPPTYQPAHQPACPPTYRPPTCPTTQTYDFTTSVFSNVFFMSYWTPLRARQICVRTCPTKVCMSSMSTHLLSSLSSSIVRIIVYSEIKNDLL